MRISVLSSYVCSSDLVDHRLSYHRAASHAPDKPRSDIGDPLTDRFTVLVAGRVGEIVNNGSGQQRFEQTDNGQGQRHRQHDPQGFQIGRASCRERVCTYVLFVVVAVTLKKKKKTIQMQKKKRKA